MLKRLSFGRGSPKKEPNPHQISEIQSNEALEVDLLGDLLDENDSFNVSPNDDFDATGATPIEAFQQNEETLEFAEDSLDHGFQNSHEVSDFAATMISEPVVAEASKPFRSLSSKFVLMQSSLIIIAILVTLSSMAFILYRNFTSDLITKGEIIATTVALTVENLIDSGNIEAIQPSLQALSQQEGIAYIWAHDAEGKTLAQTFSAANAGEFDRLVEKHMNQRVELLNGHDSFTYFNQDLNTQQVVYDLMAGIKNGEYGAIAIGVDPAFVNASVRSFILLGLGILIVLVIISVALSFRFSNNLTQPLRELTSYLGNVAEGDIGKEIPVDTNDEIGLLANALSDSLRQFEGRVQTDDELDNIRSRNDSLQESIDSFLEVAMEMANGDLTKRGTVSNDELGNVIDAVNLIVDDLGNILTEVKASANSVSVGSDVMSETTESIVKSSEKQAAVAQRTRAEIEQVTKVISEMTKRANASAKAALLTLKASQQGQQAVTNTLSGMASIRDDVMSVSTQIQDLNQRSDDILTVVESVTHLASQINLLSLSAALEAAGAGESGARFATVADEVGRLAEEAAESSSQINNLVTEIRKDIDAANSKVESSAEQVESGYKIATEAGQKLKEIGSISKKSAQLAQSISNATVQQVERVTKVSQAIGVMSDMSESSQHHVLQGQEAATQLKSLAEQLSQNLERFQLN